MNGKGKVRREEKRKEKRNGRGREREEWFLVLLVKTEKVTVGNLGDR